MDHATGVNHYRLEVMFFPFFVPVFALHELRGDGELGFKREVGESLLGNFPPIAEPCADVSCESGRVGFKRFEPGVGQKSRREVGDVFVAGGCVDAYAVIIVH